MSQMKNYKLKITNCKKFAKIQMTISSAGHLPANCPDEQLPPLVKLPPMTREFLGLVDSLCKVGCYFLPLGNFNFVHVEIFPPL